jgi:hypothetical protein
METIHSNVSVPLAEYRVRQALTLCWAHPLERHLKTGWGPMLDFEVVLQVHEFGALDALCSYITEYS